MCATHPEVPLVEMWWNYARGIFTPWYFNILNDTANKWLSNDTFVPLFNWCGGQDGLISPAELTTCGTHIRDYFHMPEGKK